MKLWWKKLSIRTQLMILMFTLLLIVELGTLWLVNWFDSKERIAIATDQAQSILRSLNQDLLKAIIKTDADTYADISFRIAGYPSVRNLLVYDDNHQPLINFGSSRIDEIQQQHEKLQTAQVYFTPHDSLLFKSAIDAENHSYGYAIIEIDLALYRTKKQEHILSLLIIFQIEILLGLMLAWKLSSNFTQPFYTLASAMQKNDISNNIYYHVNTNNQNEVCHLFNGYNRMIDKIQSTSENLRYISEHDSLTGLLNRYAIEKIIIRLLHQQKKTSHVLLSVDLDQFKLINDSLGHAAGDELLKMISHSCAQTILPSAHIARIGGDDFFIIFEDLSEQQGISFARELLKNLKDFRFVWEGNAVSVSGTIGLVAFKPFEYTLGELVKAADTAFYTAKASGRNKLHIYRKQDHHTQQYDAEIKIGGYLKGALSNEGPSRFELYAQAIVPLQYETDKVSYEVLIRMFDSEGRFLSPDCFLGVAERYQMMQDIDLYVLKNYLKTVLKHPQHLQKLASVHINLAGTSLGNPGFQKSFKKLTEEIDFSWEKLELELTETSAVGNLAMAESFIHYCRDKGIGFALDDFGTGMASFEYLKNLPFNIVKIDGSFISDMLNDPVDHAMIRYTHDISRLKGRQTVAEYVETEQHLKELKRIGIGYGQGYYLGKPLPLDEWLS